MTTKNLLMTAPAAGGGAFNPETDITWHSLFWAEGTDFVAQGYADTDAVTTWPNETTEQDATGTGATYKTSGTGLNSRPAVAILKSGAGYVWTGAFTATPTYPISIVAVASNPNTNTPARNQFLFDGRSTARNAVFYAGTDLKYFAGTSLVLTGENNVTVGRLYVVQFSTSGNESLIVDGSTLNTSERGSQTLSNGITIGRDSVLTADTSWDGDIALLGIYEGDITADASWADFETWVSDHYGITIA